MSATRFIVIGIALLLSAEPHTTEAATVRDLLKSCGSSLDSADYSYCLGVMDGSEDVAIVASGDELLAHSRELSLDICFSHPEPDLAQLAETFVAWARAYPAAGNWDEALGLVAAFRAKWPCGSIGR
jgi:hypothetical protein